MVSACGAAGESIAGTYDCGPSEETGVRRETWELREDGTLTASIDGDVGAEGTWSVEGTAGTVNFGEGGEGDPFTIEGDRLVFGPVEPGSSVVWQCTRET